MGEKLKCFNTLISKNLKYWLIFFIAIMQFRIMDYFDSLICIRISNIEEFNMSILIICGIIAFLFFRKILKKDWEWAAIYSCVFFIFSFSIAIKLKESMHSIYFACDNLILRFDYSVFGNFDDRVKYILLSGIEILILIALVGIINKYNVDLKLISENKPMKLYVKYYPVQI